MTLLAGCGASPVATLTSAEESSAQAQAKANVVGTVAKAQLAGQTVLIMAIEAKRPLLKNIVQDYAFYTFMDQQTRRWRGSGSGSRLYLGKDGGIYISSGKTNTELWYRVGTYQASQLIPGLPLRYTLDGEHTFKTSSSAIHLDIFHVYQSPTGSELEWSRKAPQLFTVN
jgi:hypothetical protein